MKDDKIHVAFNCFHLYIKHTPIIQIAKLYRLSPRTIERYLAWAKEHYPAKPELDTLIQAIQEIIHDLEIELHNQPQNSSNRISALLGQLRAIDQHAKLLGLYKANIAINNEINIHLEPVITLRQLVQIIRSLPLEMQETVVDVIRKSRALDLSEIGSESQPDQIHGETGLQEASSTSHTILNSS